MKCKHFIIEELVPPAVFKKRGQKAWQLIDPRLVETLDAIKARFPRGTMTINNWKWGGDRTQSGLRTFRFYKLLQSFKNSFSQHKYGRAIDAIFSDYGINHVRNYIIAHPNEFPHIKGIELGVSWLHIDVRNSDTVLTFKP